MSESVHVPATNGRSSVGQHRYLELFQRLSPLIGVRDVDEIATAACGLVADLLQVHAASILLVEPCSGDLVMRAATHIPRSEWDSIHVAPGDGVCGHVLGSGAPLLLRKGADFRRFGLDPRSSYGAASCAIVPLRVADRVEGVVNVANARSGRAFTRRDLELIEGVAAMIAGGLQGARMHSQTVAAQERLTEVLDNLHVGVVAVDPSRRVSHCNQRFADMARRRPADIAGRELESILDVQIGNVCRRLLREAESAPESLHRERFEGQLAGSEARLQITVSSFASGCDTSDAFLLMLEDIGQDEEIRRLREADSIKRSFIRIISHELRTPLTVLQGALPLLKSCETSEGPERAGRIEKVQELLRPNIQRLTNTVNSILDVVEIENGKLELVRSPLDLNQLVEERMRYLADRARVRGIQWSPELTPGLPKVAADQQRMRQSLYELLDNAIKFSSEGSTVSVRTGESDGMAGVWIANRGEKIGAARRNEVFEKFYQLDHELTRKTGGCGLGLYLVRNIAALHGGGIEIVDGASDETVFLLRIPFAQAAAPPVAAVG